MCIHVCAHMHNGGGVVCVCAHAHVHVSLLPPAGGEKPCSMCECVHARADTHRSMI